MDANKNIMIRFTPIGNEDITLHLYCFCRARRACREVKQLEDVVSAYNHHELPQADQQAQSSKFSLSFIQIMSSKISHVKSEGRSRLEPRNSPERGVPFTLGMMRRESRREIIAHMDDLFPTGFKSITTGYNSSRRQEELGGSHSLFYFYLLASEQLNCQVL